MCQPLATRAYPAKSWQCFLDHRLLFRCPNFFVYVYGVQKVTISSTITLHIWITRHEMRLGTGNGAKGSEGRTMDQEEHGLFNINERKRQSKKVSCFTSCKRERFVLDQDGNKDLPILVNDKYQDMLTVATMVFLFLIWTIYFNSCRLSCPGRSWLCLYCFSLAVPVLQATWTSPE